MFTRIRNSLGLSLLLSFLLAIPAFAGGWAVITVDELPTKVVAGEPLTIRFTVLQHGKSPLDGLAPTITANLYKEQPFVVHAEPGDKPGHYAAKLTFPKEGEWRWSIQAFTMDQPMPILTVAPAGSIVSNSITQKAKPAGSPMMLVGGVVLIGGLIGALTAFRHRSRMVVLLTVVSLLAGMVLLMAGAGLASDREAQAKSESDAANLSSVSEVEYGRQLFLAKGCITCHYNSKAGSTSEYWTIEMGAPDLSKFSANPEVIAMRLKDPSSVKSDTNMPNLDLTQVEIKALVVFINSK